MHKAVNLAAGTYLFVACFSCKTQQWTWYYLHFQLLNSHRQSHPLHNQLDFLRIRSVNNINIMTNSAKLQAKLQGGSKVTHNQLINKIVLKPITEARFFP